MSLLGALAAPEASAYPLPPQTLWSLTEPADVVLLATVQPLPETERPFDDVIVTLTVEQTYKGQAADTVQVEVECGVVCPAPARYEAGERVIAFLRVSTDERAKAPYFTARSSWGVVRFSSTVALTALGERIAEAVQHQQLDDPGHARVRWALRAAAEPATAWHGAMELRRALHPPPWSDQAVARLSRREQQQLRQIFLAQPRLDRSSALLLELLNDDDDEAITLHAEAIALAAAQQEARAPHAFTP